MADETDPVGRYGPAHGQFLLEKSELEGDGSLRITHARLANHLGGGPGGGDTDAALFPERGDGASEPGGETDGAIRQNRW